MIKSPELAAAAAACLFVLIGCTSPNASFDPAVDDAMIAAPDNTVSSRNDTANVSSDQLPRVADSAVVGDALGGGDQGDAAVEPDAEPAEPDAATADVDAGTPSPDKGTAVPGCSSNAACDDGLSCTRDVCASDGTCRHVVVAGFCAIAGKCVAAGFKPPGNVCLSCQPQKHSARWSTVACVSTLAGGAAGHRDGAAGQSRFRQPRGVAVAPGGRVFVADARNHVVRQIKGGVVSTYAGVPGAAGLRDGPANSARFDTPSDVVFFGGRLYVADANNSRIRVIVNSGGSRVVQTFAGAGEGYADGDAKSKARFFSPEGLAIDSSGSKLYVADRKNNVIRLVSGGKVTTVAGVAQGGAGGFVDGPAKTARFAGPRGLTLDASGQLIVADTNNDVIRVVSGGLVSTLAGRPGQTGRADGHRLAATFDRPYDVAYDATNARLLIMAEYGAALRGLSSDQVATIAGGVAGFRDGLALDARFNDPQYIAVGADGRVYIADHRNHRIRVYTPAD